MFSYVVARDFGFAPNPFFGVCTLATCKPRIRAAAKVGNWVVGTGSAEQKRSGHLVYAMEVAEVMSFNEYWEDPRFFCKRPNLQGSRKVSFGDNIYHCDGNGWNQADSHHSFADGSPNPANIRNDTQADQVLIGGRFVYFGGSGPEIPRRFRNYNGKDVCAGRGHRSEFPDDLKRDFIDWIKRDLATGYRAEPLDWKREP